MGRLLPEIRLQHFHGRFGQFQVVFHMTGNLFRVRRGPGGIACQFQNERVDGLFVVGDARVTPPARIANRSMSAYRIRFSGSIRRRTYGLGPGKHVTSLKKAISYSPGPFRMLPAYHAWLGICINT